MPKVATAELPSEIDFMLSSVCMRERGCIVWGGMQTILPVGTTPAASSILHLFLHSQLFSGLPLSRQYVLNSLEVFFVDVVKYSTLL